MTLARSVALQKHAEENDSTIVSPLRNFSSFFWLYPDITNTSLSPLTQCAVGGREEEASLTGLTQMNALMLRKLGFAGVSWQTHTHSQTHTLSSLKSMGPAWSLPWVGSCACISCQLPLFHFNMLVITNALLLSDERENCYNNVMIQSPLWSEIKCHPVTHRMNDSETVLTKERGRECCW